MVRKAPPARKKPSRKAKPVRVHPNKIASAIARLDEIKPATTKAARAIALFKSWLADDSGYDEETWPQLKEALQGERKRIGARRLFDG